MWKHICSKIISTYIFARRFKNKNEPNNHPSTEIFNRLLDSDTSDKKYSNLQTSLENNMNKDLNVSISTNYTKPKILGNNEYDDTGEVTIECLTTDKDICKHSINLSNYATLIGGDKFGRFVSIFAGPNNPTYSIKCIFVWAENSRSLHIFILYIYKGVKIKQRRVESTNSNDDNTNSIDQRHTNGLQRNMYPICHTNCHLSLQDISIKYLGYFPTGRVVNISNNIVITCSSSSEYSSSMELQQENISYHKININPWNI